MKTFIVSSLVAFAALFTNSCNNNNSTPSTAQSVETIKTDPEPVTIPQNEMFTCSMHNEVLSNKAGTCPKCGMKLLKQSLTSKQQKLYKEGKFLKSKEEQ